MAYKLFVFSWMLLIATVCKGPIFTHLVPSPNCREFTIKEEMVAVALTFAIIAVKEDVVREPVLTVSALMN